MKDGIPLSEHNNSSPVVKDFSGMSEFENIRCRNLLTLGLSATLISVTLKLPRDIRCRNFRIIREVFHDFDSATLMPQLAKLPLSEHLLLEL